MEHATPDRYAVGGLGRGGYAPPCTPLFVGGWPPPGWTGAIRNKGYALVIPLAGQPLRRYGLLNVPLQRLITLMAYTLGTAARALGRSKSSLSRDIKNGRLSAIRNANGSFTIDPAELHRVYPPVSQQQDTNGAGERLATLDSDSKNRALQAEVQGLREQLDLLKGERDDLRRRLDSESEERRRLTYLLTDARPSQPTPGGWWSRLFHNKEK